MLLLCLWGREGDRLLLETSRFGPSRASYYSVISSQSIGSCLHYARGPGTVKSSCLFSCIVGCREHCPELKAAISIVIDYSVENRINFSSDFQRHFLRKNNFDWLKNAIQFFNFFKFASLKRLSSVFFSEDLKIPTVEIHNNFSRVVVNIQQFTFMAFCFAAYSSPEKLSKKPFARSHRFNFRNRSRVQINMLTSYIDANFMYGSNHRVADSLRTLQGGQLKTVPAFRNAGLKPILPPKKVQPEDGCILSGQTNSHCFLAGDNRVNEQLALGVLHTLTVREHNRIATELAEINPYWDDETLYQETRHIVAAIVQHITYNEFLPVLLGEKMIEKFDLKLKYQGFSNDYDPSIDATIPASFGTAAFRFGHSLLPDAMEMRSVSHKLIGERKLSEMLQQPFDLYKPGLIDAYVLGMVSQPSQAMDGSITDQVTNHLFQEPSKTFGRDLASINIARAREHGVPGYMAYRKFCGLDDMRTWDDMWNHLPNSTIRHYLHLYSHPDDIDLWSAGVSEFPAPGSMLGPVFSCIIGMTFRDLKRGDRFWYENQGFRNSFTLGQLQEIRKYTLSRMLCNTADNIHTIQRHALLLPDYDKNPRVSCKSKQIPNIDLQVWKDKNYNEDKKFLPFLNFRLT
ncbi:unnamed protein product [Nesidiocoris tenuis]|uniref:Uncharacterized protein n=1 Tax=Nesidiocoris tenuis TaxID=355587 RepID=A0A6H5FYC3_9HEMI|nr:unnamed protein product [Nesidiocoris tenuis]